MSESSGPVFHDTFLQFCDDLGETFPEICISQSRALSAVDAEKGFRALWANRLGAVASRDSSLFNDEGLEVIPGARITRALWKEVSETTRNAIWNYVSSLVLLSVASESKEETGESVEDTETPWDDEEFKKSMEDMMKNLKDAVGGDDKSPFAAMGGMFEKLKEMAGMFGGGGGDTETASGEGSAEPSKDIPEFFSKKLLNGHIAKMARDLANEFKPEDFGISPEMLDTDDPAKIFAYLQEIFTKNPDLLMNAAKKIAKKIQAKFQRGEIRREEIIREIEELMKDFSKNEAFTSLFGQLGDVLQFAGKASGNEGSERRRVVQERLRKKAAEKEARKAAAAGSSLVAVSSMAHSGAKADAVAAMLLAEEAAAKSKKSGRK
jgi:hypothetical protein